MVLIVAYMSIEERVEADFLRARKKAWLRKLLSSLSKRFGYGRLICFEEASKEQGTADRVPSGLRVVRTGDILASVGRCSECDATFLSTTKRTGERWERIDHGFRRGDELPPVSLYKIDDPYFVMDGNHRVSVARFHDVGWMDVEVTEFRSRSPVTSNAITATLLAESVK